MTEEIRLPDDLPLRDEVVLPAKVPLENRDSSLPSDPLHPQFLPRATLSAYFMRWRVGLLWMAGVAAALVSIGQWLWAELLSRDPIGVFVFTFFAVTCPLAGRWFSKHLPWGPWALGFSTGVMVFVLGPLLFILATAFSLVAPGGEACAGATGLIRLMLYGLGVMLLPGLGDGLHRWASSAHSLRKLRQIEAEEELRLAGKSPRLERSQEEL